MTWRELLKQTTVLAAAASLTPAQAALSGTLPLTWDGDLSTRMMAGAHQLADRLIAEAPQHRAAFWNRDFSSPAAYEKSVALNRERFRRIIGAVDPRVSSDFEHSGSRAKWAVLEGVTGEGCFAESAGAPKMGVVLLPDAGQAPEELLPLASAMAQAGCRVVVPALIDRAVKGICPDTNITEDHTNQSRVDLPPGFPHGPAHHRLRSSKGPWRS